MLSVSEEMLHVLFSHLTTVLPLPYWFEIFNKYEWKFQFYTLIAGLYWFRNHFQSSLQVLIKSVEIRLTIYWIKILQSEKHILNEKTSHSFYICKINKHVHTKSVYESFKWYQSHWHIETQTFAFVLNFSVPTA